MRRSVIWIFSGITALVLIVAIGFYMVRSLQQQQAQLDALSATIGAAPPASSATIVAPATARPSPAPTAAAPTAAPEAPSPAATMLPTSAPVDASIPDPGAGSAPDFAAALAPGSRDALAQDPDATVYHIGARLDPSNRTIAGAQTVRLINTEGTPLNEVYFRLYVNAPHYQEGGMTVEDVRVGGQPAQTQLSMDDTTLKVALAQPLPPGQSVEISMHFTATVPTSGGGYGIFNLANGVFTLYNWHPELAVYEHSGWLLNPVTEQGDPTNTDSANYVVAFAAPRGYQVVTSGVELTQAEAGGAIVHRIVAPLTRNMVVVTSDRFTMASQKVGDATVNAYYLPSDAQGGKATLATAARAIELFSQQFGPYPYTELDVAEVKLGGAAGMESTGLIMIGSDYYSQPNPFGNLDQFGGAAGGLSVLDFTTAHEVGHQWWYGVVGSDAYLHPWLDESLTNWSAAYYVDQVAGAQAGALARDIFITLPYRQTLVQGDQRLDQPVDKFSEFAYASVVYGKGALMYDVLRSQLGDQQFFEFLRRYYDEHRFKRADSEAWRDTLAEVAGQQAAAAFYQKWVEGTAISESDLPPSSLLGGLNGLLATPTQEQ